MSKNGLEEMLGKVMEGEACTNYAASTVGPFVPLSCRGCSYHFADEAGNSGLGDGVQKSSAYPDLCVNCGFLVTLVSGSAANGALKRLGNLPSPAEPDWPKLLSLAKRLKEYTGAVTGESLAAAWVVHCSCAAEERDAASHASASFAPGPRVAAAPPQPSESRSNATSSRSMPSSVKEQTPSDGRRASPAPRSEAEASVATPAKSDGGGGCFSQDSDGDDDVEDMPLNPMSLDAKLPAGQLGVSLTRIRGTINQYVFGMTCTVWFPRVKWATVSALYRRLEQHEHTVMAGLCVDLQIAYRQLMERMRLYKSVFKTVQKWGLEEDDRVLKPLPRTLTKIEAFLLVRSPTAQLGSALAMLKTFGELQKRCDGKSYREMAAGISGIDFKMLEGCVAAFTAARDEDSRVKEETPEVIKEEERDQFPDEPAKHARKQKRKTMNVDAAVGYFRMRLSAPAKCQLAYHVSRLYARNLAKIMPRSAGSTEIQALAADLESVRAAWAALCVREGEACPFQDMLQAVVGIVRSSLSPQLRPGVDQLREYRRLIIQAAKANTPEAHVAKAMISYRASATYLESAAGLAKADLEDTATGVHFDAAERTFEEHFAAAYEDLDAWMISGNDNRGHNEESINHSLDIFRKTSSGAQLAVDRWSPAALATNKHRILEILSNGRVILDALGGRAVALVWLVLGRPLGDVTSRVGVKAKEEQAEAAAIAAPAEEGQPAGHEHSGALALDSAIADEDTRKSIEVLLAQLAHESGGARTRLETFHDKAGQAAAGFQAAYAALQKRATEDWVEELQTQSTETENTISRMARNGERLRKMLQYTEDAHANFLLCGPKESMVGGALAEDMELRLERFVQVHHLHIDDGDALRLDFPLEPDEGEGCAATSFAAAFNAFANSLGRTIYGLRFGKALAENVACIVASRVAINIVDAAVLRDAPPTSLLLYVLKDSAAAENACFSAKEFPWAKESAREFRTKLPHNRAFQALRKLVGISKLQSLHVPGVRNHAGDEKTPTTFALHLLDLDCHIRDITSLAATLHKFVLLRVGAAKDFDAATCFEFLPFVLRNLKHTLSDFDRLLSLPTNNEIERQGFQMNLPLPAARRWAEQLATFTGKTEQEYVKTLAEKIEGRTEVLKGVVPAWTSVFGEAPFAVDSLIQVLEGKGTKVERAHGSLLQLLGAVSGAAETVEVAPLLKSHPLTETCIKLALHVLEEGRLCHVVCEGVEMLAASKRGCLREDSVQKFLKSYKNEKNAAIPAAFWDEFDMVATTNADHTLLPPPLNFQVKDEIADKQAAPAAPASAAVKEELGKRTGDVKLEAGVKREGGTGKRQLKRAKKE